MLQDPQIPPPAPADQAPTDPAQIRVQAGIRAYEMAWLYYSENRVDSEKVYRWSRRLLEASRDAALTPAERLTACRDHLDRIEKLEAKVARIRKIGFGDSLDVVEVNYYRREADYWLAQAEAASLPQPPVPPRPPEN